MALNPDEYRKTIAVEDVSLGEPFEVSRTGPVRPLATETLQDLGKEYEQRFATLAPYRDFGMADINAGLFSALR